MSRIVGQDKPSLEDLTHYGVAGMKWGVRKGPSRAEIKTARKNVRSQAREIHRESRNVRRTTKRGTSERMAGRLRVDLMKASLIDNPDRAVAAKLTRGEKFLIGSLGLGVSIATANPIGAVNAAGAIAGRSLTSRAIRKQQEKRQRQAVDAIKKGTAITVDMRS